MRHSTFQLSVITNGVPEIEDATHGPMWADELEQKVWL
jgi:hypothetical protein